MSARDWLAEIGRVDAAVYDAVADVSTPRLDRAMRRLSNAANYSRISIAEAVLLSVLLGGNGRRAAATGVTSVAVTSAVVNVVVKPLGRRRRPVPDDTPQRAARQVRMPRSRSFPSGHTASAVAFASGAGRELPQTSIPLHALAALIGYSRVHTGVHYPGDVVAGAVLGSACADAVSAVLERHRA